MKTILITGTSSGFGNALAKAAIERGYNLIATARRPEALASITSSAPDRVLALTLDVTDARTIEAAVQAGIEKFGSIDVLINNAGFGMMGAVEEVSDAEARRVFDTNVFGLLAVTRAVLPTMRERGKGHIVNFSSVGGMVAFAGPSIYCGTKFAVEGISEGLAKEVVPFGIHVTIIEPGAFRTDFGGRSLVVAERTIPGYDAVRAFIQSAKDNADTFQGDPVKAAAAILQVVAADTPPLRLALGPDALQAIRKKLASVAEEADAFEHISVSTNFSDAQQVADLES